MQSIDETLDRWNTLFAAKKACAKSLQKQRQLAWEKLHDIGLPVQAKGRFSPLKLHALYHSPFQVETHDQTIDVQAKYANSYRLILDQGIFCKHKSVLPQELLVIASSQQTGLYDDLLETLLEQSIAHEHDPFHLLNTAAHEELILIYVPKHTILDKPLEILTTTRTTTTRTTTTTTTPATTTLPKIVLFAADSSQLSILQTSSIQGHHNVSVQLHLEKQARVHFLSHSLAPTQTPHVHLQSIQAFLKQDASLTTLELTQGSRLSRTRASAFLLQPNAHIDLNGLSLLKGNHTSHFDIEVRHVSPHCQSHQLFKQLLNDHSRGSFQGKIFVESQAQKTEAYQLNQNLLLSKDARCDAKPNLEIFADDVKASHGATIGQQNEEEMFYMTSRGLSWQQAQQLRLQSFCAPVLEKIALIPQLASWTPRLDLPI